MTKHRHSDRERSNHYGPAMHRFRDSRHRTQTLFKCAFALALLVFGASPALADGRLSDYRSPSPLGDQSGIQVPLNKSRIIDLTYPVTRVSVANPAIADILVVNPEQIYIVGKQLGTTNMTLWDENDSVKKMVGLEVTHDLQTLKEKMFRFLPGEKIRIESAQGAIVLSGEVSSTQKMDAALRLAETYASDALDPRKTETFDVGLPGKDPPNVLNLLQVGGAQQVMLEVKVAEISRTFIKRMDIKFTGIYDGGSIKIGTVAGGATFPDALFDPVGGLGAGGLRVPVFPVGDGGLVGPALDELATSGGGITDRGLFANYLSGNFFFNLIIDAARDQGLAKILAEPNLTALSGQEAKFLAGGEFPIPVPQSLGNVTIEYKEFGIGLIFVPIVLDSGLVSLKVSVSVSQLSNDNAIPLAVGDASSTFIVPALRKRSANSSVEVPSGQTIAIAGLIDESLREGVRKFPGLGDLAIVGPLFRSQEFEKGQTELVIFVTPRLARPIQPELVRLPTDDFVEPNDVEFYLLGRMQGRKPGDYSTPSPASSLGPDQRGTEGAFGHDL